MIKERLLRLLKTLAIIFVAAFICQPLYRSDGQCDWLLLALLLGIPFGVPRMFVWFAPRNLGIGGTVGTVVFDILIGGMIGIFVLAFRLVTDTTMLLISLVAAIPHAIQNCVRRV